MKLTEKINNDLKQAMRNKEKEKLEALRAVKTAFTLARSEKSADYELPDNEEMKIIQKLVKQRMDSAVVYKEQNRPELAEKEEKEAGFIREYLPGQMSEEELTSYLRELISKMGATGMQDMGKVMGKATAELSGKAEGKTISKIVREVLS